MLYFTHIDIDHSNSDVIENAVRAYSSKRHTGLDFKDSSSYIAEDKYFLGFESKDDLQITRIRTPFERFFPKLIVNFSKDKSFETYGIRYSLLPAILFIFLAISVLINLYYSIFENEELTDVFRMAGLLFVFILLTFIETNMTKQKINKAIEKCRQLK